LAYRLSEDGKYTVIVLEFGGSDFGPFIQMPAALAWPMSMNRYNWGYHSEPEPNLNNRRITAPRGKVIGGSSSINGMVYVRGHAEDYQPLGGTRRARMGLCRRASILQADGTRAWRRGRLARHRRPAACQARRTRNPLFHAFIEAGKQAGFEATDDYNGSKQEGFGLMEQTIYNGRRWSAANAYLRPALKREKVSLIRCFARRIVIEDGRAIGVEVERQGKIEVIKAKREVIVAASSFNSPNCY
jgi:choline dehydrogenase